MIRIVYNLISFGIQLYWWFSALLGNQKSKNAIKGRTNWQKKLSDLNLSPNPIWVHASSHGEGLMAKPLINQILTETDENILMTFFSPSGFKHFNHESDRVKKLYLPLDYYSNAKKFIPLLNPKIVVFIKYDLWMNFISEIIRAEIPSFCFSIKISVDHWYLKWYGKQVRKRLKKMNFLLTLDEKSLKNLNAAGLSNVKRCGDTRYDQVSLLHNPILKILKKSCVLLGSSWVEEEALLASVISSFPEIQFIIAPHEVTIHRLSKIKDQFGENCGFLSEHNSGRLPHVLVIDKIGLLSELYSDSDIAFIGGGYTGKLHNIIEPAAKGNMILFGPKIFHFPEAIEMEKAGFAKKITGQKELKETIASFMSKPDELIEMKDKSSEFVKERRGATQLVFEELKPYLK